ncbi:MAG TPA: hypothetical protein VG498_18340 [Terriglobales bacterium]|nr:hypothetical protein [Terriglobales bacterium]
MQGSRLFAYLFLLVSIPMSACICAVPRTPSEWYVVHHGEPTFVGVAISVESVSDVVRMGGGKPLFDSSGKPTAATIQRVAFRVEEGFDGVKTHDIDVYGFGTTCDYHFIAGQRYLVYAWRGDDGKIRTSLCTRTAPFSEATEDINFLRSVKSRRSLR